MQHTQISGYIEALTYKSDTLVYVRIDTGISTISLTSNKPPSVDSIKPEFDLVHFIKVENLNEFQPRLQECSNFGHGIKLVIDNDNILSMSIFPNAYNFQVEPSNVSLNTTTTENSEEQGLVSSSSIGVLKMVYIGLSMSLSMKMQVVFVPDMHHKTRLCCDELPLMV